MTNINNTQDTFDFGSIMKDINGRVGAVTDSLYNTSKQKYDFKLKLIEEADDMNTWQKLDAIDQTYDRHNQEVWQGILIFGIVAVGIFSLASGDSSMIKCAAHRLIA